MTRIPSHEYTAAIDAAFALLPIRLRLFLQERVDFVCGVTPSWAGLHQYVKITGETHTYNDVAHAMNPLHYRSITRPTVVFPSLVFDKYLQWSLTPSDVFLHEIGHCYDYLLGKQWTPRVPLGEYRNRHETFAEWFTAWHQPDYAQRVMKGTREHDRSWLIRDESPDLVDVLSGSVA